MFSQILLNEHFNNIAAMLRVSLSSDWRNAHPEVPTLTYEDTLAKRVFVGEAKINVIEAVEALTTWLIALVEADPRFMWYTETDIKWLIDVLATDNAKVTLSMLMAWMRAEDTYLTPAEVAEATSTNESGWRNKAAAGDIPGAVKKGKQWLLPKSILKAQGVI